jgi:hypothetical protein
VDVLLHRLLAWRLNHNGQLGIGTRSTVYRPVVVPGLSLVRAVSRGHDTTSYAILQSAG